MSSGAASRGAPERRVPLARPTFDDDEEREVVAALRSGWVTQGPRVAAFEEAFASAVGAREAVAVSSCTTALFLTLHALGIGPGDEVIVPALTFIASANAVVHTGATPVLVDVDPDTYNLDPTSLDDAIGERTRAVMPVHQLGMPADLDAIRERAGRRGVAVVEDAACAVGSRYKDRPVGSSGDPVCFSFHPRKVLVTGEGGMIATNDADFAGRLRRLRHQGMDVSDLERDRADRAIIETYPEIGFNFRMSDLQAGVGCAQLRKLDGILARRRALAARYDAAFAGMKGITPPAAPDWATSNHQSYIVRLQGCDRESRGAVLDALHRRGVGARRGLMAVHREAPYRQARRVGSLAVSERADDQTLVIPLFPDLSDEDQDYVIRELLSVLAELPT